MNIETKRHSLSHILAMAVLDLWPDTKLGIGPAIENGFYYDFALPSEDLAKEGILLRIEQKMKELIKQNITFEKKEISREEAKEIFKNQPYKLELINELTDTGSPSTSFIFRRGRMMNRCRGYWLI